MIERFGMYFTPGAEERIISVWLPVGYAQSDARYPVMYMFDGQNAFEQEHAAYGESWNLHAFLMRWEKDIIVVGIQSSMESDRRLAEYCPYQQTKNRRDGLRAHGYETMRWLTDVLKPKIDARYRTLPQRACSGVMGASTGALMSLYAVTAFNDVFSKAVCVSPMLGGCFEQMMSSLLESGVDADTRVYLSFGEDEAWDKHALAGRMMQILNIGNAMMRCGARVQTVMQEHGRHCEADWRRQTEEFLRFLWLEQ